MSDGEQKMNPNDTPMQGGDRGLRSSLAVIVLLVACIAMVLLSIVVSGHAILKILETTPFMGIMVDALGNRIPIQGYPQLGLGLAGVGVFTVLAFVFGLYLADNRNTSYRQTPEGLDCTVKDGSDVLGEVGDQRDGLSAAD